MLHPCPITALFVLAILHPDQLDSVLTDLRERLLARARRLVRNEADAEDFVQDVLVRVLIGLPTFDTSRSGAAWCNKILLNVFLDWLRDQRRRRVVSLDFDALDDAIGPLDDAIRAEESRRFAEALRSLPPLQRDSLLFRFQSYRLQRIANATGVSVSTAHHNVRRAIDALRDQLAD